MPRQITPQTTLDNLRKEAKRWLSALRANDGEALTRFQTAYPKAPATPVLHDVQYAIANEYGLSDWATLKRTIEAQPGAAAVAKYEQLATDMVEVYASGDSAAMARINQHYGRTATVEDFRATVWRLIYKVRQAGGAAHAFGGPEAQELISPPPGLRTGSSSRTR